MLKSLLRVCFKVGLRIGLWSWGQRRWLEVRVRSWIIHHAHKSPHKARNARCVYLCMSEQFPHICQTKIPIRAVKTRLLTRTTKSGMEKNPKKWVFVKKRARIIQSDFLNKLINHILSVEHFTLLQAKRPNACQGKPFSQSLTVCLTALVNLKV